MLALSPLYPSASAHPACAPVEGCRKVRTAGGWRNRRSLQTGERTMYGPLQKTETSPVELIR
jgi:hypothetical protein